ncbi:MAG: hypothetical protein KatS3mg102_1232 [Planctomycetota bacterium]|nr:MAG: hypothetical protein KatS3mg102_1232 [Planctomycetota bacterium]
MARGRPAGADDPIGEVLAAWAAALVLSSAAWLWLPRTWAQLLAPASWAGVALSVALVWHRDPRRFGLVWRRPLRGLLVCGAYALAVLPLFALGWWVWFVWLGGASWQAPPPALWGAAFVRHLLLAGLPEELFFRGYAQQRLADGLGRARRRVLGAPLTPAVVAAAALFALTHLAFTSEPLSAAGAARLLTFLPGLLFGALREQTGEVFAPALLHALCNAVLIGLESGLGSAG